MSVLLASGAVAANNENLFVDETKDFESSITYSFGALELQQSLAKSANTRTIHINTGLHLLGVKKEE